jgi:hypothetical protein
MLHLLQSRDRSGLKKNEKKRKLATSGPSAKINTHIQSVGPGSGSLQYLRHMDVLKQ